MPAKGWIGRDIRTLPLTTVDGIEVKHLYKCKRTGCSLGGSPFVEFVLMSLPCLVMRPLIYNGSFYEFLALGRGLLYAYIRRAFLSLFSFFPSFLTILYHTHSEQTVPTTFNKELISELLSPVINLVSPKSSTSFKTICDCQVDGPCSLAERLQ
jgi:hypothetical protein